MRRLTICLLFIAIVPTCHAQLSEYCTTTFVTAAADAAVARLQAANKETAETKRSSDRKDARQKFRDTLNNFDTHWACARGGKDKDVAALFESRRIDKQMGATSSGSGSTSLVPSGSVSALLGLAVEYGGLTEAFNGTTVTFRTTPAKLLGAMANTYGPTADPPSDKTLALLQRVSVSVSFDTSRTDGTRTNSGSNLLANYQQLSQATMRITLVNDRDPLAPKNWRMIRRLSLSEPSQDVAELGRQLLGSSIDVFDPALNQAMAIFDSEMAKDNPDPVALKGAVETYLETTEKLTSSIPNWQQGLDAYGRARLALEEKNKELYRRIAKAPSLSFEYDFTRPPIVSGTAPDHTQAPAVIAPDLSTASLVYVASLYESEYTLNATARFFNETQSGMSGNFRDFQLAGKWDIPVGHLPSFIAKGTLTFSGLFEHLHQKPLGIDLLINDQKVNRPGNMGVFQAKYSIPVGDSGLQIPISFTASNRTELIKEKEMRGNIGITFDLDKLFSRPK
jgi:hypothetical protein